MSALTEKLHDQYEIIQWQAAEIKRLRGLLRKKNNTDIFREWNCEGCEHYRDDHEDRKLCCHAPTDVYLKCERRYR